MPVIFASIAQRTEHLTTNYSELVRFRMDSVIEWKTCTFCLQNKSRFEFGKRSASRDGLQSRCFICQREKMKEHYRNNISYYVNKAAKHNEERRAEIRGWLKNYLLEHPCVDCGESDLRCLQFDHIIGEKLEEICNMYKLCRSIEVVVQEVAKCAVRCANCHQRKTAADFGWWSHVAMMDTN